MRTVEKALKLLNFFTEQQPEHGLSNLARLSGIDKATVLRMLGDMEATGLVEQDTRSRKWRLGAGILRLARLREAAFPVTRVLTPILERLATETGETAHASLLSGRELGSVAAVESTRSNRVIMEAGHILPLHATASGVAFTAFANPEIRERALAGDLPQVTPATPTTRETFEPLVREAMTKGYALSDQAFEAEVTGIAAPIFGPDGFACGAISVATPSSRMTADHVSSILSALAPAARLATLGLGGHIPSHHKIAA
tara:strand:+ start:790 stop:1560 length:771 start_codon:yes stop_codon:yes gene_type:complete